MLTHWKTDNKNNPYIFKRNTSMVIVYHRLSDYINHHEEIINKVTFKAVLTERTNILVYIYKQDRYRIIKGYFTDYQAEQIRNQCREHYGKDMSEADLKKKAASIPYWNMDVSHIPPSKTFQTDTKDFLEQMTPSYVKYPKAEGE